MGSFIAKLVLPNRLNRRLENSERKTSWSKRPSKGRESKLAKMNVKSGEMLQPNENTLFEKPRVSKTKKGGISPSSEAKLTTTFGKGPKVSKKKLEITNTNESPGVYNKIDVMFGKSIRDYVFEENGVSKFVRWSVDAIVDTGAGVRTDALYRASGGQDAIYAISKQGEGEMESALKQETNVHVLTGALKMFFRNLKEPILKIEDFQEALESNPTDAGTGELLRRVITEKLCNEARATLNFLVLHLSNVLQYPENNMSVEAMGIVFGPTLMRPCNDDVTNLQADMRRMDRVVQMLLTHSSVIFRPRRPSENPRRKIKAPPPPPPTLS